MSYDEPTIQMIDAAVTEYELATNAAGDRVTDLLGIDVSLIGQSALTLRDLREQVGTRAATARRLFAVVSAPRHHRADALFPSSQSDGARYLVRSAIRLAHCLGFTTREEVAVGEGAYAAIRGIAELSPLADQLAWADHVAAYEAAATLGRPVLVHRDFVVRSAFLSLGDALNSEHDPDLPAAAAVEAWLGEARARYSRR